MSASVALTLVTQARYVCQLPGLDTGTRVVETSVGVRKVLNQFWALPLNSRASLSGGQPATAVNQNAGHVPFADGGTELALHLVVGEGVVHQDLVFGVDGARVVADG
jgi:hypothetical protein